jgi:hypothetical protein
MEVHELKVAAILAEDEKKEKQEGNSKRLPRSKRASKILILKSLN